MQSLGIVYQLEKNDYSHLMYSQAIVNNNLFKHAIWHKTAKVVVVDEPSESGRQTRAR